MSVSLIDGHIDREKQTMTDNEKNLATEKTDNEIIKALECCSMALMYDEKQSLYRFALDLINRQKAEIEQYKKDKEEYIKDYVELENEVKFFKAESKFERQRAYCQLQKNEFARVKAIKDFAEMEKEIEKLHQNLKEAHIDIQEKQEQIESLIAGQETLQKSLAEKIAEIERLKEKLNHSIGVDNTQKNGYFPFD